jgi:hypothetical protein
MAHGLDRADIRRRGVAFSYYFFVLRGEPKPPDA